MKDSEPDRSPISRLMKLWAQEVIKRIEQQAAVSSNRPNPDDDFPVQIEAKEIQSIRSC